MTREPIWTESIAVGAESFIQQIREQTQHRVEYEVGTDAAGSWSLRESRVASAILHYGATAPVAQASSL